MRHVDKAYENLLEARRVLGSVMGREYPLLSPVQVTRGSGAFQGKVIGYDSNTGRVGVEHIKSQRVSWRHFRYVTLIEGTL
jgi:hypothetical protein